MPRSKTGADQSSEMRFQSIDTPTFLGNVSVKFPQSSASMSSQQQAFFEDSVTSQVSIKSPEPTTHQKVRKPSKPSSSFRTTNRPPNGKNQQFVNTVPIDEEEDASHIEQLLEPAEQNRPAGKGVTNEMVTFTFTSS